jgi:sulfur carrier protein ThiS
MAQLLRHLSIAPTTEAALALLDEVTEETETVIARLNGDPTSKKQ